MQVKFYETGAVDDALLRFAVIVARHKGKLFFCKHKERDTWELPGGRRESGEAILATAMRELYEETGALEFAIEPLCVYSVTGKTRANQNSGESFEMLFFADVQKLEAELHSEIEKIQFCETPPENLTYPLIQPKLLEEAQKRARKS